MTKFYITFPKGHRWRESFFAIEAKEDDVEKIAIKFFGKGGFESVFTEKEFNFWQFANGEIREGD
jgi:hypothetical protein